MPLKLIVTSKNNLTLKYKKDFTAINSLLTKLVAGDKTKKLDTRVVYIDDAASMKKMGLKAVASVTEKTCKDTVDALYTKHQPAYIVIFGAQDIIPFQELDNDTPEDEDLNVPSDLPYACNTAFSKKITSFTDPVRVVGRIPDVPGTADVGYVKTMIGNIIRHKPVKQEEYMGYFAVSAAVWTDSTMQSINNIFGNTTQLKISPPAAGGYSAAVLKPLSHFYNCHGAFIDDNYYGQKGNSYPSALKAKNLDGKVTYGSLVAAECCYGAQLFDPSELGQSVAGNYLKNGALSFMGSSTIAYGPAKGQGLADLICQYYMKNVHWGASAGRALLEARHKFLNISGPHLDPYELKTLAQFYILGDPSLQLVKEAEAEDGKGTIENRRINLFNKGISISNGIAPSEKLDRRPASKYGREVSKILKETGFSKAEKITVYESDMKKKHKGAQAKGIMQDKAVFRVYQKTEKKHDGIPNFTVLVVKENEKQLLGWRVYVSR